MNLDNFTNRARAYAMGRPGYCREAVEKILSLACRAFPSPAPVFADIGAGTGKLTKEIAASGAFVYAVEPNADMREQLALTLSPYPNTKIVAGTAEETGLAGHSERKW